MDGHIIPHFRSVLLLGSVWMAALALLAAIAAVGVGSLALTIFSGLALTSAWLLIDTWAALRQLHQWEHGRQSTLTSIESSARNRNSGGGPRAA